MRNHRGEGPCGAQISAPNKQMPGGEEGEVLQLPSPRVDCTTSEVFWEGQRVHLGEQPRPAIAAET